MRKIYLIVFLLFFYNPSLLTGQGKETNYIIVSKDVKIPKGLGQKVKPMKGKLISTIPEIGVALVRSSDPDFELKASKISGVHAVLADISFQGVDPKEKKQKLSQSNIGNPPNSGSSDYFFNLQWGHTAVQAPAAWKMGAKGAGVRVAVIDTGIDPYHPDLAENINMELSTSFVYYEPYIYDEYGHGTHVAGIIAAAQNGIGTIGVAPEAEIVSIKALDSWGYGNSYDLMQAIVYAANIKSDVINMSFRGFISKSGGKSYNKYWNYSKWVHEMLNAYKRATSYANKKGCVLIGAAGNESLNADKIKDLMIIPAEFPQVITVSATGPKGWGLNTFTNLDLIADYTNYGLSLIDLAAPGGNVDYNLFDSGDCHVGGSYSPCWAMDLVLSTGPGGWYYWAQGTSMAVPYASGVAALIIGAGDEKLTPSQVESILRRSADDLGKPGKDAFYGHGRINALQAVRLMLPTTAAKNNLARKLSLSQELSSIYPNPFYGKTTIKYKVAADTRVTIQIFNMQGQLVHNLSNEYKATGTYFIEWNGSSNTGIRVNNGTYICRIQVGNNVENNKLILME